MAEWLLQIVEWARESGAAGILGFSAVYILATLLMLPGFVLTLGAGFIYGPLWGTALVSPVSVVSASLAFLSGRFLARNWVSKRVSGSRRFAAIDEAIGSSGFTIVALLRLSPIVPFNLLNYSLGLTKIPFQNYVLASFLGMLPATFLYVYLGSLVTNASELLSGSRQEATVWQSVLYYGGLAATLLVTVVITRIARKALSQKIRM